MIDEFLVNEQETQLLFRDIQSLKEDKVTAEMIEHKCPGMLAVSPIPQPSEMLYAGCMFIKKVDAAEQDAIANTTAEDAEETAHEKHDHSKECMLSDVESNKFVCPFATIGIDWLIIKFFIIIVGICKIERRIQECSNKCRGGFLQDCMEGL